MGEAEDALAGEEVEYACRLDSHWDGTTLHQQPAGVFQHRERKVNASIATKRGIGSGTVIRVRMMK